MTFTNNELSPAECARPARGFREPFCAISHLIGAVLSIAALVILIVLAHGRPLHVVSFSIYGAALILLYSASTLYHGVPTAEKGIDRLRRFDHAMIYMLIAGTYTPVCLLLLRGAWGWSILGVEWGLALLGMGATLFWPKAPEWLRVTVYLLMGWLIMIATPALGPILRSPIFLWLLAGGAAYSIGTVVFATDRPHLCPGKFSAHDLWHLFVLGGSASHFVMMLLIVGVTVR